MATLQALKRLGVLLAIDDFGTGYSSLSYLQDFPFDVLKIDRSFVRRVPDRDGAALTQAIVDLARVLGLETVAEGIEDPAHASILLSLGANRGQGFGFARPLDSAQVPALLAPTHSYTCIAA